MIILSSRGCGMTERQAEIQVPHEVILDNGTSFWIAPEREREREVIPVCLSSLSSLNLAYSSVR